MAFAAGYTPYNSAKPISKRGREFVQQYTFTQTSDVHPNILLERDNPLNHVGSLYSPFFSTLLVPNLNPLYKANCERFNYDEQEKEQQAALAETLTHIEDGVIGRIFIDDKPLATLDNMFEILPQQLQDKRMQPGDKEKLLKQWMQSPISDKFSPISLLFVICNL